MTNPRIARTEEQIAKIIARMLERRIKDPRLGFVTITGVRLTGDGREATVFYTDLGRSLDGRETDAPGHVTNTAAALESARGMLRSAIGQQLGLRFTPALSFVLDASEETGRAMEDLLAQVQAADAELAVRRQGASYAGDADPYRRDDEDDQK
ncbi:ribosome-binding factor A [Propionibacterium sp. oral taxon 192 str. F0372]|uniref:30S ribosome-binding factor RbfA n=1 Tax=Propionibacterium sp. oral taxon 192 TaxID=671222 RepID=UPI000353AADB|nr:30S ribosome-binding factor RbfA [Propionibacterium sp. oral taxon 192]EPH00277.1 ribosome-binding factor A [Propionibacterium sp. oral taxon 192 str. F0372]